MTNEVYSAKKGCRMTKFTLEREGGVTGEVYKHLNPGDWFIDEDTDVCLKVDDSEPNDRTRKVNSFIVVADENFLELIYTKPDMPVTKIKEVKLIIV